MNSRNKQGIISKQKLEQKQQKTDDRNINFKIISTKPGPASSEDEHLLLEREDSGLTPAKDKTFFGLTVGFISRFNSTIVNSNLVRTYTSSIYYYIVKKISTEINRPHKILSSSKPESQLKIQLTA